MQRTLTKTSNPRGRVVKRTYAVRMIKNRLGITEPACDQGRVCGHEITWNPDDSRFYVHAHQSSIRTGKAEEHDVLATRATFVAAVRFARRRAGF